MKTNYLIILILLLLVSCKTENKKPPDLTDIKTADTSQNTIIGNEILISPSQAKPYRIIRINNCQFDLVVDNADTIYLATSDTNFITPEGFKVGMKVSQITKDLREKMTKEGGWGYYINLGSKWNLGFCEGSSCTDNYPGDTSRIKWIFKRQ